MYCQYAAAVMLTVQEDEVEGGFILKLNSRILESSELRKLDKSEKGLLNSTLISQKGRLFNDWLIQGLIVYTIYFCTFEVLSNLRDILFKSLLPN